MFFFFVRPIFPAPACSGLASPDSTVWFGRIPKAGSSYLGVNASEQSIESDKKSTDEHTDTFWGNAAVHLVLNTVFNLMRLTAILLQVYNFFTI